MAGVLTDSNDEPTLYLRPLTVRREANKNKEGAP